MKNKKTMPHFLLVQLLFKNLYSDNLISWILILDGDETSRQNRINLNATLRLLLIASIHHSPGKLQVTLLQTAANYVGNIT